MQSPGLTPGLLLSAAKSRANFLTHFGLIQHRIGEDLTDA
jgi:hypothetical protein